MQLMATIILPLTVLLVVVTFGSIAIHQKAMRQLVGERDQRMVDIAATAINTQLDLRVKELRGLQLLIRPDTTGPVSPGFSAVGFLLEDLDLGLVVTDLEGNVLTTEGDGRIWETWADDPASWKAIFSLLVSDPGTLRVHQSPVNDAFVGLISAPVGRDLFILGGFSISSLVENTLAKVLPPTNQFSIFLVDADRHVLYASETTGDFSASHP